MSQSNQIIITRHFSQESVDSIISTHEVIRHHQIKRFGIRLLHHCSLLFHDSTNSTNSTRHHAKQNVVFAVAARTAAKNFEPLAALLAQVGTWELKIEENLKENMGRIW